MTLINRHCRYTSFQGFEVNDIFAKLPLKDEERQGILQVKTALEKNEIILGIFYKLQAQGKHNFIMCYYSSLPVLKVV